MQEGLDNAVMQPAKPKTAAEYVRLVDRAIAEAEALKAGEVEGVDERTSGYLHALIVELQRIRISMADGSYSFRNQDLPFMSLVERMAGLLPLHDLLHTINQTHRHGLDIDSY